MIVSFRISHILFTILIFVPLSSHPFTFVTLNSIDGNWRFREGSTVRLECIIHQYESKGILTFTYNSIKVFACTGTSCNVLEQNNQFREFTYEHDTRTGNFTWTINPVTMDHDGKQFTCADEDSDLSYIASVEEVQREKQSGAIQLSGRLGLQLCVCLVLSMLL